MGECRTFLTFSFFQGSGWGVCAGVRGKEIQYMFADECTATPCIDLGPFMIVHQAAPSLALVVLSQHRHAMQTANLS